MIHTAIRTPIPAPVPAITSTADALGSRRDFLPCILAGGALAGASIMELAWHRAAWAGAAATATHVNLFNISKRPPTAFSSPTRIARSRSYCNAAIFVRSKDVVVVNAHSRPSSVAALLAQIKREVTPLSPSATSSTPTSTGTTRRATTATA